MVVYVSCVCAVIFTVNIISKAVMMVFVFILLLLHVKFLVFKIDFTVELADEVVEHFFLDVAE